MSNWIRNIISSAFFTYLFLILSNPISSSVAKETILGNQHYEVNIPIAETHGSNVNIRINFTSRMAAYVKIVYSPSKQAILHRSHFRNDDRGKGYTACIYTSYINDADQTVFYVSHRAGLRARFAGKTVTRDIDKEIPSNTIAVKNIRRIRIIWTHCEKTIWEALDPGIALIGVPVASGSASKFVAAASQECTWPSQSGNDASGRVQFSESSELSCQDAREKIMSKVSGKNVCLAMGGIHWISKGSLKFEKTPSCP